MQAHGPVAGVAAAAGRRSCLPASRGQGRQRGRRLNLGGCCPRPHSTLRAQLCGHAGQHAQRKAGGGSDLRPPPSACKAARTGRDGARPQRVQPLPSHRWPHNTQAPEAEQDAGGGLRIAWQYRKYIQTQQRQAEAGSGSGRALAGARAARPSVSASAGSSGGAAAPAAKQASNAFTRSGSGAAAAGLARAWCHQYDLGKPAGAEAIASSSLECSECGGADAPLAAAEAAAAAFLARFAQPTPPVPVRSPGGVGRLVIQSLGSPGWLPGSCPAAGAPPEAQEAGVLATLARLRAAALDSRCAVVVTCPSGGVVARVLGARARMLQCACFQQPAASAPRSPLPHPPAALAPTPLPPAVQAAWRPPAALAPTPLPPAVQAACHPPLRRACSTCSMRCCACAPWRTTVTCMRSFPTPPGARLLCALVPDPASRARRAAPRRAAPRRARGEGVLLVL